MGLQKQVISIPLQAGLDNENNPVLVGNDRFVNLQNVVFDKGAQGQLHKRNGYMALANELASGGTLVDPQALMAFNQELGAISAPTSGAAASFCTLPVKLNKVIDHGQVPQWIPAETQVYSGATSAVNADCCTANSITVYAYELNGQVGLKVIDETSKSVYYQTNNLNAIGAGSYNPKCLASTVSGIRAVTVFTTDATGALYATNVSLTAPEAQPTTVKTGITNLYVNATTNETIYDACRLGSTFVVSGSVVTGGSGYVYAWVLSYGTWDVAYYHTWLTGIGATPVATNFPLSNICMCPAGLVPGNYVFIAGTADPTILGLSPDYIAWGYYYDAINNLYHSANQVTQAPQTQPIPRVTCIPIAGQDVSCFWETTNTAPDLQQINTATMTSTGAALRFVFALGASLCSQPFSGGDGNLYLFAQFVSSVQPTLFLLAIPGAAGSLLSVFVAGKYLAGNAGGPPTNNRMPAVSLGSLGHYLTAVSEAIEEVSINDRLSAVVGVTELSLAAGTGDVQGQQLGQNLHLAAGSLLWDYDGSNLVEHGFNLYPEQPILTREDSWLTLIYNNIDPTLASAQALTLNILDNASSPGGPVGQFIVPGEYITFNAYTNGGGGPSAFVFWFSVNGVGSAPSGSAWSGFTAQEIIVNSSMTAIQLATTIAAALTTGLSSSYTVAYTPTPQTSAYFPQVINLTAGTHTAGRSLPALATRFTCTQAAQGSSSAVGKYSQVCITGTPASLISNGQYCLFTSSSAGTTLPYTYVYFWFTTGAAPGVLGSARNAVIASQDPDPYGIGSNYGVFEGSSNVVYNVNPAQSQYLGININLAGSEDAAGVAGVIADTFFLVLSYFGFDGNVDVTGNTVTIISDSSYVCSPANYASNPAVGGVQQGYVGQNLTTVNNSYVDVQYVSVYEWVDAQGQLHQSAPSVPATISLPVYTTAAGAALQPSASVQVGTLPLGLTEKVALKGASSDLDIAVYRTTSDGEIFYRVTSPTTVLLNQVQVQPIEYLDQSSDSAILSNQPVYTTGDILENDAPPGCSVMVNHQDRLWIADSEDSTLWWYSQPFSSGYGVSFSSLLTMRVNPSVATVNGGPIVAGSSMDGNFVSFQSNLVQFVSGTGPDETGANNQFSTPQLVASSTAIGCRDPGSVVLTPGGIIFKSTQGFYMLARGLELQYIGAPVKAFNADVVSAATALDTNTQVRFLSELGTTLVWDWFYNAWGTFTNHQGSASISFNNSYYYVNGASGLIFKEAPGVFSDNGVGFPLVMTTAWLKAGNIQGFQRIWKLFVQGNFPGGYQYQVQIAYDFNPAIVDTFTLNPTVSEADVWGSQSPWGETAWGEGSSSSTPSIIQFRVFPSSQLCEAMQMTFQDITPLNVASTLALNGLDLEIGKRVGGYKRLGPGNSLG
jgi:hypothetical protein